MLSLNSSRGTAKGILLWVALVPAGAQQLPSPKAVAEHVGQLWAEAPVLAAVTVALPALLAADRPVADAWKSSPLGDAIFGTARLYGERWTPLVIAAGLAVGGWVAGEERLTQAGIAVGSATLLTAAIVLGLKVALGRARPFLGMGSLTFRSPGWHDPYQSFPSGHTAVAFMLSAVLSQNLQLQPVAAGALYTLATLTALSRLYHRAHWSSDIVAGAVLGYTLGWATAEACSPSQHRKAGWRLMPIPAGIAVSLRP